MLTITASHTSENDIKDESDNQEAKDETDKTDSNVVNYICKERSSMSYKRSFNVEGIDVANINAKLENGILELTLPKKAPKEPEKITINVA